MGMANLVVCVDCYAPCSICLGRRDMLVGGLGRRQPNDNGLANCTICLFFEEEIDYGLVKTPVFLEILD